MQLKFYLLHTTQMHCTVHRHNAASGSSHDAVCSICLVSVVWYSNRVALLIPTNQYIYISKKQSFYYNQAYFNRAITLHTNILYLNKAISSLLTGVCTFERVYFESLFCYYTAINHSNITFQFATWLSKMLLHTVNAPSM